MKGTGRKQEKERSFVEESRIRLLQQEIKVGAFLALTIVILTLFLFFVGDLGRLFKREGYPLFTQFDSVAGLEKRTVVRMAGVKVGFVKDIRLKGSRAEVELSIYPDVAISRDSKATLASLGLLGEKYVEILPGNEEPVQGGGAIGSVPAVSFDQLGTMLVSIGEEIKEISRALRDWVGDEGSRSGFRDTMENLSQLSAELRDFFRANKSNLSESLANSSRAIDSFDERTEAVAENLDKLIRLVRETVEENRGSLKGNLDRIRDLLDRMEHALESLTGSLEKVSAGQGTLGKLVQEPDLYEETREAVEGVRKVLEPVSSLRANLGIRAEYYGESRLVKSVLSLKLWPASSTFLLAQVVHDPWEDRFTYSTQGGIRRGAFAARAGILESELGIGMDAFAFRERVVFSLEGYDFNRESRPHFRAWTRFAATRNLHLVLGLDDFTLASKREFFFGMSLGF